MIFLQFILTTTATVPLSDTFSETISDTTSQVSEYKSTTHQIGIENASSTTTHDEKALSSTVLNQINTDTLSTTTSALPSTSTNSHTSTDTQPSNNDSITDSVDNDEGDCLFTYCNCVYTSKTTINWIECHDILNQNIKINKKFMLKYVTNNLNDLTIKNVYLSRIKLDLDHENLFNKLQIQSIDMVHVETLHEIPTNIFKPLSNSLIRLYIAYIDLNNLNENLFLPLQSKLKSLHFKHNSLYIVNKLKLSHVICRLKNLEHLSIIDNNLLSLPNFRNCSLFNDVNYKNENLRTLDLTNNRLRSFSDTQLPTSLEKLVLTRNRFRHLDAIWFAKLVNLEVLDISHNKLTQIDKNVFSNLFKLKILNLKGNCLKQLPAIPPTIIELETIDFSYQRRCIEILTDYLFERYFNTTVPHSNRTIRINLSGNRIKRIEKKAFCHRYLQYELINNNKKVYNNYKFYLNDLKFIRSVDVCALDVIFEANRLLRNVFRSDDSRLYFSTDDHLKQYLINLSNLNCSLNVSYVAYNLKIQNKMLCLYKNKLVRISDLESNLSTKHLVNIKLVQTKCKLNYHDYSCSFDKSNDHVTESTQTPAPPIIQVTSTVPISTTRAKYLTFNQPDSNCLMYNCTCTLSTIPYTRQKALDIQCIAINERYLLTRNPYYKFNNQIEQIQNFQLSLINPAQITKRLFQGLKIIRVTIIRLEKLSHKYDLHPEMLLDSSINHVNDITLNNNLNQNITYLHVYDHNYDHKNDEFYLPINFFYGISHLKELVLMNLGLTKLNKTLFAPFSRTLTYLALNNNELNLMDIEALSECIAETKHSLSTLMIQNNHLTEFLKYLHDFSHLTTLDLSYNEIKTLNYDSNYDLNEENSKQLPTELVYFYFKSNRLKYINPYWFKYTPNLVLLDLEANNIEHISHETFKYTTKLRELHLKNNLLKTLPSIHYLKNLQLIDVSYQRTLKMKTLNNYSFIRSSDNGDKDLSKIDLIDLSGNEINRIEENTFCSINLFKTNHRDHRFAIKKIILNDNHIKAIDACTFIKLIYLNQFIDNLIEITFIENDDLVCTCDIEYLLKTYPTKLKLVGSCYDQLLNKYTRFDNYTCTYGNGQLLLNDEQKTQTRFYDYHKFLLSMQTCNYDCNNFYQSF